MAAHLGIIDEDQINNASYVWFNSILEISGKILNFESISNMYGRTSFDKKGAQEIQKIIIEANPLHKKHSTGSAQAIMSMPSKLTIIEAGTKDAQIKQAEKQMGDLSWIKDFI